MPNIAIIKYCNLRCPYCFADDMIQEHEQKEMTLEQLQTILNWLGKTPLSGHIGIIGGEPTLHPQFKEIMYLMTSFCNRNKIKTVIFTNGIELYKYTHLINDAIDILVNVNKLKPADHEKLLQSLDDCNYLGLLKTSVCLGCNLYSTNNDYSYFWDVVDRYNDIKAVRMSITAPVSKEDKSNKFQYYEKMKPILLNFLNEAKSRSLQISYDCNQIPLCLFSEEQQEYILSFGEYQKLCTPVVDITADFKASSCFGSYEDTLVDCFQFDNLIEIERYFQSKIFQRTARNCGGQCVDCQKLQLLQCQGGCLSFAV